MKTPAVRPRAKLLTWMLEHQNATTGIFLGMMAVLAAIATGIGTWLARDGEMLDATTSALLYTVPFVLPIGIAAVLGGLVVHPRGWIPALGVSVGMGVGVVGQLTDEVRLFQAGAVIFALGIVGFWVVGWIARFPMWIGWGRSKWVEVQRPDDEVPLGEGQALSRTWVDTPATERSDKRQAGDEPS